MKRIALFAAFFVSAALLAGQSVPQLFQQTKDQVKAGSWQDAMKTMDALDAEAARPGNENVQKQLQAPLFFYRGVCEANLGDTDKARTSFEAFLDLQPNASMDPAMYSKKAVAAFEAARKGAAPAGIAASGGSSSLFTSYQEFKAPPNMSDPPDERWAEGPVQWIMTADEKASWAQLAPADRAEFVEKFWEARNPNPGNGDNVFKTTFERRAAFADARFVQDEKKRGSLTDRGMVFVLLGPPTYGGRRPIRAGEDTSENAGMSTVSSADARIAMNRAATASASGRVSSGQAAAINDHFSGPSTQAAESNNNYQEVWHYRRELLPKGVSYIQVDVAFITKKGYGSNVLQRDSTTLATLQAAKKRPE